MAAAGIAKRYVRRGETVVFSFVILEALCRCRPETCVTILQGSQAGCWRVCGKSPIPHNAGRRPRAAPAQQHAATL
jgi:hypothetical protein